MRRLRAAALLAALCAIAVAGPAAGQSASPEPAASVRITSFTPYNTLETPFRLSLRLRNTGTVPIEDARIRLTIYQRVLSRSALNASLQGRPQTVVAGETTEWLSETVTPDTTVVLPLERDLARVSSVFAARRSSRPGVYPVRIRAEGSDRELWTGYSAIVFLPTPPEERLNVTWVLPVHHKALFDGDGTYPGGTVDEALGPEGVLSDRLAAAADASSLRVTYAPSGLLADQLADLTDGFARRNGRQILQSVAGDAIPRAAGAAVGRIKAAMAKSSVEIAATPYSRADLVSLIHAEMADDVGKQVSMGLQTVSEVFGRTPNVSVFVPAGLRIDSRAAAAVAGYGVRTVVMDPSILPPHPGPFGHDRPVRVSGRGGVRLNVLPADEAIRAHLEGASAPNGGDPVLLAQSALAETASAWLERPTLADGRAIVIATATTPPAASIRALSDALSAAPWVSMRSASELVEVVPPEEDPEPLPLGNIGPRAEMQTLRTARRAIDILSRVVVQPPDPAADLDRLVLAAASADWAGTGAGTDMARSAKQTADRIVSQIGAAARRVTLTSRTGQLPVTILNETGYAVAVQVRLLSSKVDFPDGERLTVQVPGRSETVAVPAKALAAGTFGVKIELRTPDGTYPIGDDELVVRSTAVSAVALIAVGGGAAVLIAAWFRRGGKRRRGTPAAEKAPRKTNPATGERPQPA
ncbi:MAG TPA: DUF6049 family protein [Actinomycetota bacterium]|nr:DUF6049 family protein [Actinomycetota bacterium]